MARRGENIYHRKDGRWEGRYIKGRREDGRAVFGSVYARTYAEVKRVLIDAKSRHGRSLSVHGVRDIGASNWMDRWLCDCAKLYVRESTYEAYQRIIELHLKPVLGTLALCMITPEDIQSLCNGLSKRMAPSTVRGVCRLLRSILKEALNSGLIQNSPYQRIRLPRDERKKPRVLSLTEQRMLEQASIQSDALENLLCLYAGLRVGEVCALRWIDFDSSQSVLRVRGALKRVRARQGQKRTILVTDQPKSGASIRAIPLPRFLCAMLSQKQLTANGPYIISGQRGRPVDPRTLQSRFVKLAHTIGIHGAHMHTMRHTYATRCLEKHIGYEVVSELLGHSSPQITLRCYAHCTHEHLHQAVKKLSLIGDQTHVL